MTTRAPGGLSWHLVDFVDALRRTNPHTLAVPAPTTGA